MHANFVFKNGRHVGLIQVLSIVYVNLSVT